MSEAEPISLLMLAMLILLSIAVMIIGWRSWNRLNVLSLENNALKQKLAAAYTSLRQDDERFRKLADASFEGIVVHDDDKLTDVNGSLLKMLGYSSDEMLGKSPLSFILPEDRAKVRHNILRDEYNTLEVRAICRDGRVIDVEICSRPLTFNGKTLHVAAVRDITERKRNDALLREAHESLEREVQQRTANLRQTNERLLAEIAHRKQVERELVSAKYAAETANTAKSQFLANMSHELRTPLNAVIGFSEVIKNEMLGPVHSIKYIEYAKDIYNSGLHLLSLINDILDLSKIEAGQANLHYEEVAFDDVMETALRLLQEKAAQKQITIHQQLSSDLPAMYADKRSIKQIFINLLSNAIKFTHDGGNIWVAVQTDKNASLIIEVRDDGIGIREQDIKKVLEPFTQAENVFARKYQGTGLGLPLVKALTELHDGELSLKSALHKGTTVTLTFPPHRLRKPHSVTTLRKSSAA